VNVEQALPATIKKSNHNLMPNAKILLRAGYSLIEILIALTILSLIFWVGLAGYRQFASRQELISLARQVKGDIRLAQELALAGQKSGSCTVLNGFYFRVQPPNVYTVEIFCDDNVIGVIRTGLLSGTTISSLSPDLDPPNTIFFKTLGQGTNIPAPGVPETTFTLTQRGTGNSAVITVTAGGEIRGEIE